MKKQKLKTLKQPEDTKLINFKISDTDKKKLKRNAKLFTGGNVSEWVRYASLHFMPSKKDLA